ncbi:MAG: ABC transporter substrate-binding protein [Pseudobacteriovorax sp.]|nr:ABC transporter substrate-binding protein [Pseudobacteriovorax sp.]
MKRSVFILWLIGIFVVSAEAKPSKPKRIVSTFVGADAILVELLKNQHQRLLALSPLSKDARYSPIYDQIPNGIGDFGSELENLLVKKPDLIIAASYTRAAWLKMLEVAGVPYIVLKDFRNLDDIQNNIALIAGAIHEKEAGNRLIASIKSRLEGLKACPLSGKTVVNYSDEGVFMGGNTLFDDLMSRVGLINLASKLGLKGWSRLSDEAYVSLKPQIIVGLDKDGRTESSLRKKLSSHQLWGPVINRKGVVVRLVPGRFLSSVSHHSLTALEMLCAQ